MIEIRFWPVFILISIVWVAIRLIIAAKNRHVDWLRELKLLTVYVCIVVITRIVYFPWHLENGHVGPLIFDPKRILPFWLNLVPFVPLFDSYDDRMLNLFGNIAMFIPVGMAWPFCFKQLDSIKKVVLAGFGFSLLIELSQLLFCYRGTDIDDLITNTTGVLIGACIYFLITRTRNKTV